MRDRPNFRIIEGDYSDDKYDSFKEDYMDITIPKKKLLKKYDLNEGRYQKMIKRVKMETGFSRQAGINPMLNPHRYLTFNNNGTVTICKDYGPHDRKTWGTYPNLEVALVVRDLLEESDWSLKKRQEVIDKYSTNHIYLNKKSKYSGNNGYTEKKNKAIVDAYDKYDEFEAMYFGGEHSVARILEELNFTQHQYNLCLAKIREKYGYTHKKLVRGSL